MLPRSLVVAAALACLTAGPLAGTASAGWSDPVPISTAGADASSAFTAMNDSGVTVVDWGENYENGGVTRGYIHRPGGPDCSLDSALADLGSGAMVAVTPSGEVALVGAPADYTLSAMVIPPGQCTGAVTTIERSAWPVNDLQVLADGAGGLTAFWERDDTHELRASYRPPGGSWQPPKLAANPDERLTYPHYAVDDDGDALASWMSPGNVYVASRQAGGAFTTKLLRSAYRVSEAEVALDHHGNGLLGWFESDNDSSGDMMLAEWPAGGDLQPPVVLQHGAPINDYPLFAVAPDDEVTMAFVGTDDMALVGRARPPHGTWGPTVPLARFGSLDNPQLAYDSADTLYILGRCNCDPGTTNSLAYAAVHHAGTPYDGSVTLLSGSDHSVNQVAFATGPPGYAVAFWPSGDFPAPFRLERSEDLPGAPAPTAAGASATASGSAPADGPDTASSASPAPITTPLRRRACHAPTLRRHTLAGARRLARAHGCALGSIHVRGRRGRSRRHVVTQRPAPGAVRPAGARIAVTMR